MAKLKNLSPKLRALAIAIAVVCLGALGAVIYAAIGVEKIASEDDYTYENPDETKAQPDEGMTIDGILDEEVYKNNTWLYLHNESGGAPVDIAMTSWYGEKGMYFVYDVTEETPIYVNLDRASYLNSGIEMYLAPSYVSSLQDNSVFEIDMLPTGDMVFKKSNGKGGYTKVTSTNDKTAYLGATTKGGEVNTEACTGYCLELFIPWEYMEWLDMDVETMKESFAYVNPAHITSYNETGTDTSVDRFWYYFVQQKGAGFGSVASYFRFDETGALDTVPVTLVEGEHYTISGPKTVIPGMEINVKIKAEEGYALNSILINNEENIKKVSFGEDGTVVLTLRGQKDGLTISAATEAVTEGNKTLSGVINVNKYGGDSQDGLSASYKGPNGERPIEFDSKGNFVLTDLKQGYYEILIEKEGYEKVVRGIYLNRDFETILDLEYAYFETISGTAWGLEEQNKGVLIKNPGSGVILTTDSFNKFTVEANFMYDAKLAEESQDDSYFQQRSGFRIEFSNGKYWHINLMNEGGTFKIQYAKHTKENSIFGWKTVHNLTEAEIAKYQSTDGIKLSVLRDGKYANVYLDGKLVAVEVLDDEYETTTARIGFEGWIANPEAVEIPFKISNKVNVDVRNAFFTKAGGFDISGQYNNVLALSNGGRANIDFAQKYVNMDLRLTVQDYADPDDTAARNDVLFVFPNGAHVSFGICKDGDVYRIQSLNRNANDGQEIYSRFKSHGVLTEEEAQKYVNGGVEFRIARVGTEVTLYIDNRMVAVCDLTNNNSGVKATDEATVTIRHYDDSGVKVEMPFEMTDKMSIITVEHKEDELGVTTGEKQNYLVGDTVVLNGAGKDGYYCTGIKVNGEEVPLNWDGTYTFTAEDKAYVVESTYDKALFKDNNNWGLLEQNQGVIIRPEGQKEAWLDFYDKKADFDITLKVKGIDETSATAIRFSFNEEVENTRTRTGGVTTELNEWATFRIVKDQDGAWKLMSMNDSVFNWKTFYVLSEDEVNKYLQDGIDFRVVRAGTMVYLYLDGVNVCDGIDISKDKDGNPTGITEEMKATVSVRHYGSAEEDVKIPFEATEELDYVAFKDNSTNGKVVVDGIGLVGTEVTIKGQGTDGYYCSALKVDGKSVNLNWDGTYTFTATKKDYTVEGTFDKAVFVDNDGWNLLEQKDGVVSLPITHGNSSYLEFIEKYADMHLTLNVRDYIADGSTGFSYAVKMHFDEVDKDVIFRLTYDSGIFGIQSMGGTYGYKWFYQPMTTEEVAALQSEDGIDFEVVRYGSTVYFYLDDKRVGNGVDLTIDKDGNETDITADMEATVSIKSDKNVGHVVEVPFTITDELPLVTLTDNSTNGSIVNVGGIALVGDEVTIKGKGENGYFAKAVKVDGQNVTLNWDGTYTFTATQTNYTVEGTFVEAVFVDNDGWNLLDQDEGKISLPADREKNNSTYLEFIEKYTDMNLNLNAKDYIADGNTGFSYVVKMNFAEANKDVIFRLTYDSGIFGIQSMGGAYGYTWFYQPMTEAEVEALQSADGIDFKVIRYGTGLYFYLNDHKVCNTVDLSTHGITADMEATVSVRADGNLGNEVVIPFTITDELPLVTITDNSDVNGSIEIPSGILVGDTVTIKGKGNDGYFCKALKVDGQTVTMNTDGTYTFTATKNSYTVEGTFVEAVFVDNPDNSWNLLEQDNGIISLPNGGNGGWLQFYDKYTDMDLTVTARDYADASATNPRTDVLFVFENERHLSVGICKDGDVYRIQTLNRGANDGKNIYNRYASLGVLTDEEVQQYLTEGIEFRVVRAGTYLHLYIGDRKVNVLDLTNNASGVTATTEATVYLRHYDDAGVAVEIPFTIDTEVPETVSINLPEKVNTQFMSYFLNEEVILTVDESDGNYYTSLAVDGADASFAHDGTYTFTATKNSYDITASFKESVFATDQLNYWYLTNQHKGIIAQRDDYTDRANTPALNFEGYFGNVDVSIIVKAGEDDFNADGTLKDTNGDRTAIGFYTVEDGNVGFSILLQNGKYYIGHAATKNQETGKNMYDNSIHTFTDEETELIKTEGIELRVVRVGKDAHIYLGGNWIYTYTMQYEADEDTALWIRRWDDTGVLCPIEYKAPVVLPDFNITSDEHGSVSVDASNYSTDKSVVVKVEGNDGYYYDSLTINGEDITVNNDGTYTITNETADTYNISATFKASIFKENQLTYWYLMNQHKGIVVQRDDYTGTTKAESLDFAGNFGNVDVSIIVKAGEDDFNADGSLKDSDGDRTAIGFYNSQDGGVGFSILLQNGKYYIGHAATKNQETGKNMYDNSIHTFTDEETALIKSEGIELRVVRIGKEAHLYLGGNWIHTYTMQYDADEETGLWIRRWDDTGVLCPIEYKISEAVPTFEITDVENGAISIDTSTWALDNKVTLTVTPETGYNRTSLIVKNGDTEVINSTEVQYGEAKVLLDNVTTGTYTVDATFAGKVFKDSTVWDLSKQHTATGEYQGSLIRPIGGHNGTYLELAQEYTDIHFTSFVRISANNSYIVRMYFNETDGTSKNIIFQIYNNDKADTTNGSWVLKTWGDSFGAANKVYYNIPSELAEKMVSGDGLKFEVVRVGSKAYVYMDGQRVCDAIELTGVTDSAKTVLKVRLDETIESTIEIPFAISTEAADRSTVYVASTGTDATSYGTDKAPVQTLEYALSMVDEGGTIYIKDAIDVPSNVLEAAFAENVIIAGVDTDDDNASNGELNFTASKIGLMSSTKFTNIKMTFVNGATVYAWGNTLEIAEDVTGIEKTGTNGLIVYGGGTSDIVSDTEVILKAGIYQSVFGGGDNVKVTGNTSVTISHNANVTTAIDYTNHGKTYMVYGGGNNPGGTVVGNTTVNIGDPEATPNLTADNATRFNYVIGGGRFAQVEGDCTVNFYGYAMSIYGGGRGGSEYADTYYVKGNTYVNVIDGYTQQIFGGCENGIVQGNTNVNVEGGEVVRRIYGGSYNDNPLTDSNSVQGHTNVKIGLNATLGLNYDDGDNSLYAISRKNPLADNEWGTFIFNKDDADKDRVGNHDSGLTALTFPSQSYHYLVLTNGNDASGNYGTINPADDKLSIVPATGKIAEITINGVISYFGEGLYTLPTLSKKTEKMTIEINFVDQSTVGDFIASVNGTLYTDVDMAVGEANKEGAIVNILDDSKMGKLTIADCENGTVTTTTPYYVVGSDVTVTVTVDTGYAYSKLQMNDGNTTTDIRVDYDGNYSFTTAAGAYTITAEFEEAIFNPTDGWYLNNQLFGDITQIKDSNGTSTSSTWLGTSKKYVNFELAFDVKEYADANALTRTYAEIKFTDGTVYRYSVAKNGNETDGYKYTIQPDYKTDVYTLNATEIASMKDEDGDGKGLEFRIVRQGTTLSVHLNGVYVCSQEIAASKATEAAQIVIRRFDDIGEQITIPFEFSTEGTEATFTNTVTDGVISSFENGTVTLNKTSGNYVVGEKVTLTVAGANTDSDVYPEYYYDSLTVNGKTVTVDNDGNFTFVAQKENTITATFKEALFDGSSDPENTWHLMNQHFGIITQNGTKCSGTTADLKFAESYTYSDLSIKVKAGEDDFNADGTLKDAGGNRIAVRYFANSTNYGYSIILDPNDGNYYVRTSGTKNGYGTNLYPLSEAQNAKIKTGDGIIFRLVQLEGRIYIYLDDELVYDADLAFGTAAAIPAIRNYDDGGLTVPMEYSFATVDESTGEIPSASFTNTVTNSVVSFENGTVTLDKDNYVVGEPVTITVAGDSGYYYDSLIINGKSVIANYDGTYTFAAEEVNTIESSFAASVFNENDNWHIMNQHFGIVAQRNTVTGNTSNLEFKTKSSISDTSIILKAGADDFDADGNFTDLKENGTSGNTGDRTAISYWASAGDTVGFGIVLQTDGKYYVQHSNTTALGTEKYTKVIYPLSDEESAMIINGDGIELRSVRIGTTARLYLDGKLIYEYALPYAETTNTTVFLKRWDDGGLECPVGYKFGTTAPASSTVNLTCNIDGAASLDTDSYIVGQKVIVSAEEGYSLSGVTVNGKSLTANADGTYSFKTEAGVEYTVDATAEATTASTSLMNVLASCFNFLSLLGMSLFKF